MKGDDFAYGEVSLSGDNQVLQGKITPGLAVRLRFLLWRLCLTEFVPAQ